MRKISAQGFSIKHNVLNMRVYTLLSANVIAVHNKVHRHLYLASDRCTSSNLSLRSTRKNKSQATVDNLLKQLVSSYKTIIHMKKEKEKV